MNDQGTVAEVAPIVPTAPQVRGVSDSAAPEVAPTMRAPIPSEPPPEPASRQATPITPSSPATSDSAPTPAAVPMASAMVEPQSMPAPDEMPEREPVPVASPMPEPNAEPALPEPTFRDPFDPDEPVRVAASTGVNTESPTWVPELNGFIFYPAKRREWLHLWRVDSEGDERWFQHGEGHPTHYHDGFVYAGVRGDNARIIRINVETKESETVSKESGIQSPQDMDRFSDDSIYVSSWPQGSDHGVFRVHTDGSVDKLFGGTVNALQFSPDCQRLYTSHGDNIDVHDVAADGALSNRRRFYSKPGVNGVGVDSAGNLIVGGGNTAHAVNPEGEKVGELRVGGVNFAYGGEDGKLLFITTGSGASWTRTRVRGAECNGLPN